MSNKTKPEIDFPGGDAPTELQIRDIEVGTGDEAKPGQVVEVHYAGVTFETGEEFDASWNRGSTFKFPLGAGRVIKGWDQGVVGMKVGGRRELVIPSHLAYGNQSPSPLIPAGSTLIFVVDLISV
ncbi:FKBP-type peptidyl-prolyl cis-trans isomerase [Streptomyces sp. CB01881]|uniref:FKBP-type peptidyl-prolyl cis-trans isomerase n=1 Tax=Streptomycetaceae TaxID=2062 RepID=UPI0011E06E2D|nr:MULTISPECIES: FKBP-type peptidyl-prolyl cis-trans isomerase [Streptomycetaceae]MBP0453318.1 FKBP-type peptidyl-prolyl cis-trans isomerase [Kitasatospora sp. RG8]TYC68490.1 FKBP-type peptidyl-prolyl cis-trans isomerase [Streptomyces sp. CB01881]